MQQYEETELYRVKALASTTNSVSGRVVASGLDWGLYGWTTVEQMWSSILHTLGQFYDQFLLERNGPQQRFEQQTGSDCLAVRCLNVWLSDCLTVWMPDCQTFRLYECLTVWMSDCLAVRCLNVWLSDCQTLRLSDWMYSCQTVRLSDVGMSGYLPLSHFCLFEMFFVSA